MKNKKYSPHSRSRRWHHAGSEDDAKRYNFQEQVGFLLRKAYQSHSLLFQRMCPDPQLTTAQFAVLCALRDGERAR